MTGQKESTRQQGRAKGLYDEQLQREQQEKWLFGKEGRKTADRGANR